MTKRTVKWTLTNGKEMKVEIKANRAIQTKEPNPADGWVSETSCYRLLVDDTVTCKIDGKQVAHGYPLAPKFNEPKIMNGVTFVALLADKVGLTEENYNTFMAAYNEAKAEEEAKPNIVEYRKREAEAAKREAEYQAHRDKMKRAMTE